MRVSNSSSALPLINMLNSSFFFVIPIRNV